MPASTVIWSTHAPVTGDSILSVLFDYEDPLSVVLEPRSQNSHNWRGSCMSSVVSSAWDMWACHWPFEPPRLGTA